jgi:hypothetical protein
MPDLPDNDVTVYLVLNDYRTGLAFVETALDEADLKTDTGFHWRIVHIELDLQPAEFGSERPIGIHVYIYHVPG